MLSPDKKRTSISREMPGEYFQLLINVSPINSKKIINALKDYLVCGVTRKEACMRHGVSPGYFSTSLGKLQNLNSVIYEIILLYLNMLVREHDA